MGFFATAGLFIRLIIIVSCLLCTDRNDYGSNLRAVC